MNPGDVAKLQLAGLVFNICGFASHFLYWVCGVDWRLACINQSWLFDSDISFQMLVWHVTFTCAQGATCVWPADVNQRWRYPASLLATSGQKLHQSALNHQPTLSWANETKSISASPSRWLSSCQQRGELDYHVKQVLCLWLAPMYISSQGKAYHANDYWCARQHSFSAVFSCNQYILFVLCHMINIVTASLAASWWLVGEIEQ